ncbi:protein SHI RELATED SEQUENCE 3-like [Prosopis cineraria]|uniref:protein SHI RELATED SEQUENCE 3-like n=1 Tax=Prosopis cineraria TaxID=364024 RepID=UPI002410064F|nr:protein SHI RELATED SEQUENCE 3-like [Prosopis cineraria]
MEGGEVRLARSGNKCQDCGNQAKKGCEYKRCRTCCNNKGFECETHVHSTWVPVDRRRRHTRHNHNNPYPDKKVLKFPGWLSMTAMFRCVQVRSRDDWVNEYAYHTSVTIGGRVFCGLVYDQGPSQDHGGVVGETSSSVPLILQHNNPINVPADTHIDAATIVAPPLSSSSARDSAIHPTYSFPFPSMPYFSSPHP